MIAGSPRGTDVVRDDGSEDAGAAPAKAHAAMSVNAPTLPRLVPVPRVISLVNTSSDQKGLCCAGWDYSIGCNLRELVASCGIWAARRVQIAQQ